MYQEVCCSNIANDIIKNMKVDQRNKLRKIVSLSLDTSSTNDAIENYKRSSTQAQSIEIYDFRNSRSEILPMMT